MKCPVCSNVSLTMSERSGIEIDYCPQCRGVWLDRGELDKIIERSQREVDDQPPRRQTEPPPQNSGHHVEHRKSYDQHHGRKKSLWHELFD